MGSVKSSGDGASVWAKVQSGGVNIGAHEQPSGPSRPRPAGDDDDDGSGMAWVKKRRQLKEQEKKNNESAAKQTSVSAVKSLASASDHNSPAAKEEAAEDRTLSTSPAQMDVPLQEAVNTPTKEHHLQAVTLPPVHHHHHRGHSHNTLERLSSTGKVENERRDSADTLRNMRPPTAQESTGVDLVALPEDGRQRTESVKSRHSTSSSSSSGNDDADADADEEDLESPRDGEDEDDEDTEVRAVSLVCEPASGACLRVDLGRDDDRSLLSFVKTRVLILDLPTGTIPPDCPCPRCWGGKDQPSQGVGAGGWL